MNTIKSQIYYLRYIKFIEYCKNNPPQNYKEIHHILPKSLGGTNDQHNLITLTARQHFIAHWMLWKTYRNPKMTLAFWSMRMIKGDRHFKINSKTYQLLKEEHASIQSTRMKLNNPMKNLISVEKVRTKHLGKSLSELTKQKMSVTRMGVKKSEITKQKISEASKGKAKSHSHKQSMRDNHADVSGTNNPMYGRSAVKERNLKWYTDGTQNKFIPEGTHQEGWFRGRTIF